MEGVRRGAVGCHAGAEAAPTFGEVAREWWDGVENGAVGRRKRRKGLGYSETTLAGYRRSLFNTLLPAFEDEALADLDERRWQTWVDKLSRDGLSRSRIAKHLGRLGDLRLGIAADPEDCRPQPDALGGASTERRAASGESRYGGGRRRAARRPPYRCPRPLDD